jgi:hypothetical protein
MASTGQIFIKFYIELLLKSAGKHIFFITILYNMKMETQQISFKRKNKLLFEIKSYTSYSYINHTNTAASKF